MRRGQPKNFHCFYNTYIMIIIVVLTVAFGVDNIVAVVVQQALKHFYYL